MQALSRGLLAAIVALVVFLLSSVASAEFKVPPRPDGPVHDGADVLTGAQERALEIKLEKFRDAQGPSVVVAFIPSLDGEPINEAAYEIFSAWGIGKKKQNDGVLLLISVAEAKKAGPGATKCGCARIEVGEYIEGTLTDARSLKILKDDVLAAVVSGKFDEGATKATDSIIGVLSGDPEALSATDPGDGGSGLPDLPWWLWVALVLLGLYVLYIAAKHGLLEAFLSGGGGSSGGSWGGGSSGGGSSGGSSFGGGSSGGGGASV
jgi:uncharacterized protein